MIKNNENQLPYDLGSKHPEVGRLLKTVAGQFLFTVYTQAGCIDLYLQYTLGNLRGFQGLFLLATIAVQQQSFLCHFLPSISLPKNFLLLNHDKFFVCYSLNVIIIYFVIFIVYIGTNGDEYGDENDSDQLF